MTAILATTGFAASPTNDETSTESKDPVEAEAYGVVNFEKGTDRFPTTIMPSGIVNIGGMAYIASKWTLEPGATMNVTEDGFILDNELNIKPQNTGAVPVQCAIDGKVYYEYTKSDGNKVYTTDSLSYVDGKGISVDKPDGELKQTMSKTVTGSPILTGGVDREFAVINVAEDGVIKGGTVTFVKPGSGLLESDSTDLGAGSSLNEKTKYKLKLAESNGCFKEEYISKLPNLKYYDEGGEQTLNLSDISTIDGANFANSDTLKGYLNSFGFNPDSVTFSDKTALELLTSKDETDVIQIPANSEFSKAANKETLIISTNLHNVNQEFTQALKFTGIGDTIYYKPDTLIFSGNNSQLIPEEGVKYESMNVTFCKANSWIGTPKDKEVSFGGACSTLTICEDTAVYHKLKIGSDTYLAGPNGTKLQIFGTLTYGA